jgi:hypothetical protein
MASLVAEPFPFDFPSRQLDDVRTIYPGGSPMWSMKHFDNFAQFVENLLLSGVKVVSLPSHVTVIRLEGGSFRASNGYEGDIKAALGHLQILSQITVGFDLAGKSAKEARDQTMTWAGSLKPSTTAAEADTGIYKGDRYLHGTVAKHPAWRPWPENPQPNANRNLMGV